MDVTLHFHQKEVETDTVLTMLSTENCYPPAQMTMVAVAVYLWTLTMFIVTMGPVPLVGTWAPRSVRGQCPRMDTTEMEEVILPHPQPLHPHLLRIKMSS